MPSDEKVKKVFNSEKAAKGTVVVFGFTFIGLGVNYIYGILLARLLGLEAYGLYSLGLSVFTVASMVAVAGLDHASLTFLPKLKRGAADSNYSSFVGTLLLVGFVISCSISMALYFARDYIASNVLSEVRLVGVLDYFLLSVPFFVLVSISLSMLQANHDVNRRMVAKYIVEPFSRIGIMVTLFYFSMGIDAALIAFLVSLMMSFLFVIKPLVGYLKESVVKLEIREVLQFTSPLFVGLLFSVMAYKSDVLIVGYYLGAAEVGLYFAAFQTAAIMAIVLQSVESILAPYISEAVMVLEGGSSSLLKVYQTSLRWVVLSGFPLFLIFTIMSDEVLSLFGDEFRAARSCFVLLAVAQFVNLATGSANYILILAKRTRIVMYNSVFGGVVQLSLMLVFIKMYGIEGAAMALFLGILLVNFIRLLEVYAIFKIHPYSKRNILLVSTVTAVSGLLFYMREEIPAMNSVLFTIVVLVISTCCMYWLLLEKSEILAIRKYIGARISRG